jgi:hypothetical protein
MRTGRGMQGSGMEGEVRKLFGRYQRLFNQALAGSVDMDEVASLYAPEFIGAAPAGVTTGKERRPV